MLYHSLCCFIGIAVCVAHANNATTFSTVPNNSKSASLPATSSTSGSAAASIINHRPEVIQSASVAAVVAPPFAISDSGVTTQNTNISTNVIDKPDTKLMANKRIETIGNSTIASNRLANETAKIVKNGEKVHNRGVYNTGNIPESFERQPQQAVLKEPLVSKVGNASTVPTPSKVNATISIPSSMAISHSDVAVNKVPSPLQQLPLAPGSNTSNSTEVKQKLSPTTTTSTTVSNSTVTSSSTIASTAVPKKPEITFSVEDDPHLKSIRDKLSKSSKQAHGLASEASGALSEPVVLQSSELMEDDYKGRDYIMPIIGLIFAVPLLLIFAHFASRRLKNYWSKRNYQRMDYLINDMYN